MYIYMYIYIYIYIYIYVYILQLRIPPYLNLWVVFLIRIIIFLQMNDEVKKVSSLRSMVSFLCARKLNSYLFWAKLYPVEIKLVSCKCNCNRCQVCQSVSETDTFTCSNDGTTYKTNYKF